MCSSDLELSKPEGANGVNYVLLRDHFDDGQYQDRWYVSALDSNTSYQMTEMGTELETIIQRPLAGCKGLRFQHFSTVDAVNAVYHLILQLNGRGMTAFGLTKNGSLDNGFELALDNDLPPQLIMTISNDGVIDETPIALPNVDYQGIPLDLRITKNGAVYHMYARSEERRVGKEV